jgi:ABC-type cobalamin/Fe3+-siderophores transport system ATPase subunit
MTQIKSITIENVKGIECKKFQLDLYPNKPCIWVAPNGFGKSSIACAFKSLNLNKIKLKDKDYHNGDIGKPPVINIELETETLEATSTANAICKKIGICVINNPLITKVSRGRAQGGVSTASASLEIESVCFVATVPNKSDSKKYDAYKQEKNQIDELLKSFNTTRFKIKSKEIKNGNKKSLVAVFPKADDISNGQRDIISFISQLHRVTKKLNKSVNILVIDEIFDYFDDANLISFQYHIIKLIEEFKKLKREIFPILLTHLDTGNFHHSCFDRYKIQVRYLAYDSNAGKSRLVSLIKYRDNQCIKENVDKYFMHYHNEEIDLTAEFKHLNLNNIKAISTEFYEWLEEQIKNYLNHLQYDNIAVLLAIRIQIERLAYLQLGELQQKKQFIETHGTKNKLEYCSKQKICIPDVHFLLGIIYNDALHWKDNKDYDTPIHSKLEHPVIRNLVKEIFKKVIIPCTNESTTPNN